jgi:hypothetical protein
LYPILFLAVAYALSAGNAGTGFRYRTHLVLLSVAAVVVLRQRCLDTKAADQLPLAVDLPLKRIEPPPSRLAPV